MARLQRGVVFDMDDTLYLERDYVRSGFQAVAAGASSPDATFAQLWEWFETGVRGDTFDRILAADPDWAARTNVASLVTAYREHTPTIRLIPAADELLRALVAANVPVGVLTDGPEASQRKKATALGLFERLDHVLLTDTLGRAHWKPAETGFEWHESRLQCAGASLVYIGDNPKKDFVAPRRRGWTTVRLRIPGQLRSELEAPSPDATADVEVRSWDELSRWVRTWVHLP